MISKTYGSLEMSDLSVREMWHKTHVQTIVLLFIVAVTKDLLLSTFAPDACR